MTRRIARPVAGSVRIAVAGVATQAFAVDGEGWVTLDAAPAPGARVTASFTFDVVVRFAVKPTSSKKWGGFMAWIA